MRRPRRGAVSIAVAATLLAGLLSGCSGDDARFYEGGNHAAMSRYAGLIREFLDWYHDEESTMSTRQYEILSDFWVSDAELHEVRSAFLECMANHLPELEIELLPTGGSTTTLPAEATAALGGFAVAQELHDHAWELCEGRYLEPVNQIWAFHRRNPEGLSEVELVQRCWADEGVEGIEGLTFEELLDFDMDAHPDHAPCVWDPFNPEIPLAVDLFADDSDESFDLGGDESQG